MAILCIDGFDSYAPDTTSCAVAIGSYLDNSNGMSPVSRNVTRFGTGFSLAATDGNTYASCVRAPFSDRPIATMGMAVQKKGSGLIQLCSFGESSGSDFQVGLQFNAGNQLVVRRGNPTAGTILASGTRAAAIDEWNYIEMKVGIHASTGFVEVRINNITDINVTGVNTRNTANSFVNRLCLQGGNGYNVLIDDLYITDENLPNSGFLGDCRVQTLVPTGSGINNGWTPTGATSGWQCVDDTAAQVNGTYTDTDFVYASSTGLKFEYTMADLSGTSPTIFGITLSNVSKKGDAGARTCQNLIYTNSTEVSGVAYNLSTSYINYSDIWNTNPVTGSSWTPTEINNIQAGQMIST